MYVIFFIFIPPDKSRNQAFVQPPIPPLYHPTANEYNQTEMYMYANIETVWKNYFPRSIFFPVRYFDETLQQEWRDHEDWMIGWSAKGPYNQPLAIWRYAASVR